MGSDIAQDVWQARADVFLHGRVRSQPGRRRRKASCRPKPICGQVASLRGMAAIAHERRMAAPSVRVTGFLDLSDMPDALARPLLRGLGEIGGYDPALPYERQTSSGPEEQRGTVLFTARNRLSECLA